MLSLNLVLFYRRPVFGLNEGERLLVNTRVGTPWVVTDGPGNCLEMIFPREDLFRYNLTVPDAFFGPE